MVLNPIDEMIILNEIVEDIEANEEESNFENLIQYFEEGRITSYYEDGNVLIWDYDIIQLFQKNGLILNYEDVELIRLLYKSLVLKASSMLYSQIAKWNIFYYSFSSFNL